MHQITGDLALLASIELNTSLGGNFGNQTLDFRTEAIRRQGGDSGRIDPQQT